MTGKFQVQSLWVENQWVLMLTGLKRFLLRQLLAGLRRWLLSPPEAVEENESRSWVVKDGLKRFLLRQLLAGLQLPEAAESRVV